MLEAALADPANWTALDAGADIAGLGQRPDVAQVFLLRDDGEISLALLPMSAQGYNGRIDAILALRGDMNTLAGIAITRHAETPGLGGRIEEPSWQASFPGTEVRDESGQFRFNVARGDASSVYEVDGITGATRTSNAIERMVRFWLGPDGYGPFLRAVERGEF
jgi:Na+-transporting NADH:ubiquinone oxidoreductase subunit C